MVLTDKFRATTIFNAFLLNAIVVSFTSFFTYLFHKYFNEKSNIPFWVLLIITLVFSFSLCMAIELTLYHLFAYGEGMLAKPTKRGKYNLLK